MSHTALGKLIIEGAQQAVDIKNGKLEPASVTTYKIEVKKVRAKLCLNTSEFSKLLGVSGRTIENWEQGRTEPTGAAKTLLAIAEDHPDLVARYA